MAATDLTRKRVTTTADPKEAADLGEKLAKDYDVHSRTSCSTCHR